jgi:hypothetical protein
MGKETKSSFFNASKLWKVLENMRLRNDFKPTKIALNTLLSNSYINPTEKKLFPLLHFFSYRLLLLMTILDFNEIVFRLIAVVKRD